MSPRPPRTAKPRRRKEPTGKTPPESSARADHLLTGVARVVFLAVPVALVVLLPVHELLGAVHPALGVWDEVSLALMAASWAWLRRAGRLGGSGSPWLTVAVFGFWLVCAVSTVVNHVPGGPWFGQARKLIPYTTLSLFLSTGGALVTARWRRGLVVTLVVVGGLAAAWGLVSYVLFFHPPSPAIQSFVQETPAGRLLFHAYRHRRELGRLHRAVGSFLNPNVFGSLLVVVVILGTGLLLGARRRLARALLGMALVLCLAALALTNSRGSMVGLAAGLGVLGLLKNYRVWFILVGLGAFVAVLTPGGETATRVSVVRPADTARFTKLGRTWRELSDHRLLGRGLGTRGTSDMQYATLLAETGVVGEGVFGIVLLTCFVLCLQAFRRATDLEDQCLHAALAGVWTAAVTQALVSDYFAAPQRAGVFWLLMGLAAHAAQAPPALLPPLPEDEPARADRGGNSRPVRAG